MAQSLTAKGLMDPGCDLLAIFTLSNHPGADCFGFVWSRKPLPGLESHIRALPRLLADWPSLTFRDVIQFDTQVCPLDTASAPSAVGWASMSSAHQEIDPLVLWWLLHPDSTGRLKDKISLTWKDIRPPRRLNLFHIRPFDFLEVVCGIFYTRQRVTVKWNTFW